MSGSRISFWIFFVLTCFSATGQEDFYDESHVQEIRIYFEESNWDHILDSLYVDGNDSRMIASVQINGETFDSVGIRFKGFSSVSVDRKKNPFNIKLDHIRQQSYQGIDKIKLSNVIQDPSFLREVLSYHIARDYMPAPRANFANVYINDTLWGLYTNVESINKDFLEQHFPTTDNAFFKCNPETLDFFGENSNLGSSPGTDSSNYFPFYELRSDHGWEQLVKLIDSLNNYPESIEGILNVDRTLWMHAFNYALINFDSYVGYAQNYYLYQDDHGLFHPIIWDLNMSFASFRFTDASEHFSGFNVDEAITMDPLLHHSSISVFPRPLMRNLFMDDTYRRMYLAHLRTIMEDYVATQTYYDVASHLHDLISPHVMADTIKFYSDSDFLKNIDSSVLDLIVYPGIRELMEGRYEYLKNYPGIADPPSIDSVRFAPEVPTVNSSLTIHAKVEGAKDVRLYVRSDGDGPFIWHAMLDDGQEGDEIANDGIFSRQLVYNGGTLEYYVYAEDDQSGVFSPTGAAYSTYKIQDQRKVGDIVINEFMALNSRTIADESNEFDDWIEIFNNSDHPILTSGLFLSDDSTDQFKWPLPDTTIASNDYLLIWADDAGKSPWHANFRLASNGETLIFSDHSGLVLDRIDYSSQVEDVSYGRYPNGVGPFQYMSPTPLAENVDNDPTSETSIAVSPNPVVGTPFEIRRSRSTSEADVFLYSMSGQLISASTMAAGEDTLEIPTSHITSGSYQLHLKDDMISESVILVIINQNN